MELPFSAAAQRNQMPIYEVLNSYMTSDGGRLLEIGSGTAQHATFLGAKFPNLHWVTSDQPDNHAGIKMRLKTEKLVNVHGPEKLVIGEDDFPGKKPFDYVFTANTLHIMSWKLNKSLFKLLGKRLREGALTFFYGPFNYDGEYSSPSNAEFDKLLKTKDPSSGIRNFEDIVKVMEKAGFKLLKDHEMPANNRLLVFERLSF